MAVGLLSACGSGHHAAAPATSAVANPTTTAASGGASAAAASSAAVAERPSATCPPVDVAADALHYLFIGPTSSYSAPPPPIALICYYAGNEGDASSNLTVRIYAGLSSADWTTLVAPLHGRGSAVAGLGSAAYYGPDPSQGDQLLYVLDGTRAVAVEGVGTAAQLAIIARAGLKQ